MRRARIWAARIGAWGAKHQALSRIFGFFLYGYLVLAGVVGFFGLLSAIPSLRVDAFSVEGNAVISTNKVIENAEAVLKRPFAFVVGRDVPFWVPQKEVAAMVYALDPHVKSVSVDGRFSRTLSVTITEESPSMLWCGTTVPDVPGAGDVCWFANERGTIYAEAPQYPSAPFLKFYTTPAPIFFDQYPRSHEYPSGYAIADETTMTRLRLIADALPERGYAVSAVGVTLDADVVAFTAEGVRFLFSLSRDVTEDMRRLEALREALQVRGEVTELSQVDLRFGEKVYYR
jgi:hypothetical protein